MPKLRMTILAVLLVSALVGCTAAPSVTPQTVTPVPTSMPSNTPTPTTLPIPTSTPVPQPSPTPFPTPTPSPTPIPSPTLTPINDFCIQYGSYVLEIPGPVRVSELKLAFGTPTSDIARAMYSDGMGGFISRKIQFDGVSVVIHQSPDEADIDLWSLDEVNETRSDLSTPRGLKVGLSVEEVVQLLGTDGYRNYYDTETGLNLIGIEKNDNGGRWISLDFASGLVSSIDIQFIFD